MKVLFVDDSQTMRKLQKRALETTGEHITAEAGDGVQALAVLAKEGSFDMALVDWNMPNMDGIALIRRIREIDQKISLIMVTTESDEARINEAVSAGADNYVLKPFTQATLLGKIQRTLARKCG